MIHAHPLVGVGVNTFILNYNRYKTADNPFAPAYAHNHYLHLTAEIGFLGLVAFIWLLASTIIVCRRALRHADPGMTALAAGIGCSLVAFLITGLLESSLFYSYTNIGFWIGVGLLQGLGSLARSS